MKKCGFTGKKCLEHDCMQWIQIMGNNPNTGQEINDFGCAMSWLPILLIEGSQQTRQAGAAIESLRNLVANPELIKVTDNRE